MISYATGETVTGETEEEAGAEGGGEERMTSEHTRLKLARQMYYEVVTAWVDPRFRRMNFSWTMYSSVFEQGNELKYIQADMTLLLNPFTHPNF